MSTPNLQALITELGLLSKLVSDFTQGFNLSELIGLTQVANQFPNVVANANKLLAEYEAASDADRAALEAQVTQQVTFPSNINVQALLQKTLRVAVSLSATIEEARK